MSTHDPKFNDTFSDIYSQPELQLPYPKTHISRVPPVAHSACLSMGRERPKCVALPSTCLQSTLHHLS